MPSLPDKSFDHVLTDPPYSEHTQANRLRPSTVRRGAFRRSREGTSRVDFAFPPMTDAVRFAVACQLVRLARGWVLVFSDVESVGGWLSDLESAGASRRTTLTWVKSRIAPKFRGDGPAQGCESIVAVWAGEGRSVWNAGGRPGTYEFSTVHGSHRRHVAEKPLDLMQQIVLDFTEPKASILDPYAGAGTTLAAAKSLGRLWTGWEISPLDHATASRRVAETHEQVEFSHLRRVRGRGYGREERRAEQATLLDDE